MKNITVAIADPYFHVRKGLIHLIEQNNAFSVTMEADSAHALLDKLAAATTLPDLILTEIKMPGMSGYKAVALLKSKYPNLIIVVFSTVATAFAVNYMRLSGAAAFVSKNYQKTALHGLLQAVFENYDAHNMQVHINGSFATQNVLRKKTIKNVLFSEVDEQFLALCATGLSYKQMENKLGKSLSQVDKIRARFFDIFEVQNRPDLVAFALENGLLFNGVGNLP